MPRKKISYDALVGQRKGRLLAVSIFRKETARGRFAYLNCLCDCGGTSTPLASNFYSGTSSSCGCKAKEAAAGRARSMAKHNMSSTPEHRAWCSMIERCGNPNNKDYKNYGGRGISVFDNWKTSFLLFFEHIGPRPSKDHSLDRIKVNGNYEPGNVRWATQIEQQRNRRSNRLLTINGETATFKEWCDRHSLRDDCVRRRINVYGWSIEKALNTPKIKPSLRNNEKKTSNVSK